MNQERMKLHLGCGWRNFGADWVHIDGGDYKHLDEHDIVNYTYRNVDLIYTSHAFAYFDREEGIEVLKKWFDSLKVGGILRIAIPDFEAMIKLYSSGIPLESILGPLYGKMPMGDDTIYERTTYDFVSLKRAMEQVGFKNIERYDWRNTEPHSQFDDHSQAYLPHMDKENGTLISLNVEGTK